MPTNNFKLFDQNKANLLTDTEYANATQRLNGVQTGVASSQLNNKFAYQVSLVAYAIAQIMNQNGLDASDTLAVSAFVGNLGGALLQKVADKASSAEAVAGVLTNKYISPATMKAAALLLSGGVMTGTLDMNNNQIINLPTPTSNSEPTTKEYVDEALKPLIINWELIGTTSKLLSAYNTSIVIPLTLTEDKIRKYKKVMVDITLSGSGSGSTLFILQNSPNVQGIKIVEYYFGGNINYNRKLIFDEIYEEISLYYTSKTYYSEVENDQFKKISMLLNSSNDNFTFSMSNNNSSNTNVTATVNVYGGVMN